MFKSLVLTMKEYIKDNNNTGLRIIKNFKPEKKSLYFHKIKRLNNCNSN